MLQKCYIEGSMFDEKAKFGNITGFINDHPSKWMQEK